MRLQKCMYAATLLIALLSWSCKSQKVVSESQLHESRQLTDSVSLSMTKETKIQTVPQTTAKLTLSLEQIDKLPVGAVYQEKDGNATGTVSKTNEGNIEFTANCDSLLILIDELSKEVYHFQRENTALKTNQKEEKIVEVNKLNGWQWFQIYGFWVYVSLTLLFIGYKIIKSKFL